MADLNKVHQALQSLGTTTGNHNLRARANGSAIEIHGTVRTIAEKQNIMRTLTQQVGDMGLVNLIEVQAEPQRPVQAAQPQQQARPLSQGLAPGITHAVERRTHTVKKGETLSHIAQHYYGRASEYKKIFDANRNQISDPDKIREGMTLVIP